MFYYKFSLIILTKLFITILSQECILLSHTISIETKDKEENLYDANISIASLEKCELNCELINNYNHETFQLNESYSLQGRFYNTYLLTNLVKLQEYRYQCNTENSEIFKLQFPKHPHIVSTAIISGLSNIQDTPTTLNYIQKNIDKYDFVMSLGDMGYEKDGEEGNQSMDLISPLSSKVPFMITPEVFENEKEGETLMKRFHMPNKVINKSLYYSFDVNNAHFVSIASDYLIKQSTSEGDDIDRFLSWIKEDLSKTKQKWKIIFTNEPLYCSDLEKKSCTDNAEILRKILEEILHENKVDIIISAGMSNYERLLPIYKSQVDRESLHNSKNNYLNPKNPVYLVCGSGHFDEKISESYSIDENISAINIFKEGICEINISDEEIKSNFWTIHDGKISDSFLIKKTIESISESSNKTDSLKDSENKSDNKDEEETKPEKESENEKNSNKNQELKSNSEEENEEKE